MLQCAQHDAIGLGVFPGWFAPNKGGSGRHGSVSTIPLPMRARDWSRRLYKSTGSPDTTVGRRLLAQRQVATGLTVVTDQAEFSPKEVNHSEVTAAVF